ncbi:bifunctional terpene synthase/polyprenyl synthetase family protein [Aspergillus melleus]|uniref:bifunctional terpene synthase/polyprenyl synthetase family protein n=1 Tax=Aspergillus melleus TaxID=138277 RepID=UPI001E8EC18F|nr:uncharacterized protein LDX57_005382 [Aspergillus melleus]KAH8427672.1 hypothetical protein LDX57_005382 [Aspergillus melleus]
MDVVDFEFQFSKPEDEYTPPPGYFSILPYRVSKTAADIMNTACNYQQDCISVFTGKRAEDLKGKGGTSARTHAAAYMIPECPPGRANEFAKFLEMAFNWDDISESLHGVDYDDFDLDMQLMLLSIIRDEGSADVEYQINKEGAKILKNLACGHEHLIPEWHSEVRGVNKAHRACNFDMTFEDYKCHRPPSFGGSRLFSLSVAVAYPTQLTKEELASVEYIFKHGYLSAALTNDLYSFTKEFDEQLAAGKLQFLQNAVGILIRGYGYSEDEAIHIIKEEVKCHEHKFLDEFRAWYTSSVPKSEGLKRYVTFVLLCFGGMCRWMSESTRYSVVSSTTREEREQLLRQDIQHAPWKLSGYGPPQQQCRDTKTDPSSIRLYHGEKSYSLEPFLGPFQAANTQKLCLEPYEYTRSGGGKSTFPRFIDALHVWFPAPAEPLRVVKTVLVKILNATLMMDDIQDRSLFRRGFPAAYTVFGINPVINSATYLYANAGEMLLHLEDKRCAQVFFDELHTLAHGQALDLEWDDLTNCPTVTEYITMVDNKTGGYFRMSARLVQATVGSCNMPSSLAHFITLLGRYYQIRDDYEDLKPTEHGAHFGDDLSDGKFSLPVIHFLQNAPSASKVRRVLFHRSNSFELTTDFKLWILSEMRMAGSLAYTEHVLETLYIELRRTLSQVEAELGPNKLMKVFLLALKV